MKHLGEKCLLFSQFIESSKKSTFPINSSINNVKAFNKWRNIKNEEGSEQKFKCRNTSYYLLFPEKIIPLDLLNEILIDLINIYRKEYPFSTKEDFIDYVLDGTITKLHAIVEADIFPYGDSPSSKISIYFSETGVRGQIIDYIIDSSFNMDFYKQYFKKVLELISNLDFDQNQQNILPNNKSVETKTNIVIEKKSFLHELITNENNIEIVREIKIKYKNIKGKRLKLLLVAFQDLDLLPKDRIGKKFHECCKNEFDWSVGSYPAMNDYKFNVYTDKDDLEKMKQFLNSLIQTQ